MTYRYQQFAERHLAITDISGEEAMVRCPVHDDSKASMQFNLRSGLWVCFACKEGGSIKRLARELGIDFSDNTAPDLEEVRRKLKMLNVPNKEAGQPKPIDDSILARYRFPTEYWKSRGLKKKTIDVFELGYDIMHNAATIPIRNQKHQLLGVVKRFLDDDVDLRYRYPKGFKRSKNLMYSGMVEEAESTTCVMTEGSVDSMAVWQAGIPSVPLLGSSLSLPQVLILRRLGITDLVTFFDNDKAGRSAHDSCIGLKHHNRKGEIHTEYVPQLDLRRWFFVRQVNYESGMPSDPGAMASHPKMIRRAVREASRIR